MGNKLDVDESFILASGGLVFANTTIADPNGPLRTFSSSIAFLDVNGVQSLNAGGTLRLLPEERAPWIDSASPIDNYVNLGKNRTRLRISTGARTDAFAAESIDPRSELDELSAAVDGVFESQLDDLFDGGF